MDRESAGIAKVFLTGRSQAVRLPKAFRLPGSEARVTRVGNSIVLTPIVDDLEEWFAKMDAAGGADFPDVERSSQPVPPAENLFD